MDKLIPTNKLCILHRLKISTYISIYYYRTQEMNAKNNEDLYY